MKKIFLIALMLQLWLLTNSSKDFMLFLTEILEPLQK